MEHAGSETGSGSPRDLEACSASAPGRECAWLSRTAYAVRPACGTPSRTGKSIEKALVFFGRTWVDRTRRHSAKLLLRWDILVVAALVSRVGIVNSVRWPNMGFAGCRITSCRAVCQTNCVILRQWLVRVFATDYVSLTLEP